jgi:hypothetical protein
MPAGRAKPQQIAPEPTQKREASLFSEQERAAADGAKPDVAKAMARA